MLCCPVQISTTPCKSFKRLATAVQKYGHMYYHFVQEVLPRIILLRPYLDADTKLLTFGSPYELKWLAELGIPEHMIEVYDPSAQYCAEELLVPNMSPIVTPPKENYELVREKTFIVFRKMVPINNFYSAMCGSASVPAALQSACEAPALPQIAVISPYCHHPRSSARRSTPMRPCPRSSVTSSSTAPGATLGTGRSRERTCYWS